MRHLLVSPLCLAALLCTPTRSEEGPAASKAARIRALIADLGHPQHGVRTRAQRDLLRTGDDASPFVVEALEHDDAEVRRWARALWRVPFWAWPLPRTTYHARTRLPREVLDRGTCIRMVLVPAGTFLMGAPTNDPEADGSEWPRRRVRISRPFYLGPHEITRDHWNRVMDPGADPRGSTRWPKTNVSFDDIEEFLRRSGFRLPTEAEWEYACCAGTTGTRYGAADDIAWHAGNSRGGRTAWA